MLFTFAINRVCHAFIQKLISRKIKEFYQNLFYTKRFMDKQFVYKTFLLKILSKWVLEIVYHLTLCKIIDSRHAKNKPMSRKFRKDLVCNYFGVIAKLLSLFVHNWFAHNSAHPVRKYARKFGNLICHFKHTHLE